MSEDYLIRVVLAGYILLVIGLGGLLAGIMYGLYTGVIQ